MTLGLYPNPQRVLGFNKKLILVGWGCKLFLHCL